MKKIIKCKDHRKKIEFYTLVTRYEEYKEMVLSAKESGFSREDVDFYYFDNSEDNNFDGYSGLNEALRISTAEYIIFCHQDILFDFDDYEKLNQCIEELNRIDSRWAVAGNAGKSEKGYVRMKISDPHGPNQTFGPFPSKVISLDENFLIINNKYNLSCSYHMSGYHLYGLDLCTNAINLGLNCYVIDFYLHHKSAGKIDKDFFKVREIFIRNVSQRIKKRFFSTTCTNFYVGKKKWFNKLINNYYFMKIYIYLLKNFGS